MKNAGQKKKRRLRIAKAIKMASPWSPGNWADMKASKKHKVLRDLLS